MTRLLGVLGRGAAWIIALALIVAAAIFGGRSLFDVRAQPDLEISGLPVAVFEVRHQDTYKQRRFFSGRIAAAQVADASFEVSGEVAEVFVQVGDAVERGAPLAKLDPLRLELREREVAAQFAEAKALLDRAETTRDRIVELVGQGFATDQELDDADAERNTARERVRVLERGLARAKEDADDAILRARFSGFVVGRYVDAGAVVQSGQPIVRLNEAASLEAEISVPSDLARTILPGDAYTLISDDQQAEGTVLGIGEDVDPLTRSRLVRFSIANDPGFVPGSLVRLALEQERRARGAWVPLSALQESYRGLWSVYVVEDETELVRRKDVEIISIGDDQVFVRGTLEDGDRVIPTSTFRFVPGQKVRVESQVSARTPAAASASTMR